MSTQAMIQALYIYPIKSCQGISVETLELSQTGPLYDRNWMITDENGQFLTQRTHEHLAKIKTKHKKHKNNKPKTKQNNNKKQNKKKKIINFFLFHFQAALLKQKTYKY